MAVRTLVIKLLKKKSNEATEKDSNQAASADISYFISVRQ